MKNQSWFLKIPKILRLHQWVKNLLLFVPVITAHRFAEPSVWQKSLLAFFAFSFVASGTYIVNDLLDLNSDRAHPRKKHRPFASNAVPISVGFMMAPALIFLGLAVAWTLGQSFFLVLCGYLVLTLIYSSKLKRLLLWDVVILSSLYTLRIFAGSAASGIIVSSWLLAFSLFIFMSLAIAKRVSELKLNPPAPGTVVSGRGYQAVDIEALSNLGASSGFISVLVFALYVTSSEVNQFYRHPQTLWFVCPLILYWISRIWILSGRGELHDDPIVFAITDRMSYLVLFFVGTLLVLST